MRRLYDVLGTMSIAWFQKIDFSSPLTQTVQLLVIFDLLFIN